MIHFQLLGWVAVAAAVIGFVVPGRAGWWLAVLSLRVDVLLGSLNIFRTW
jgi:hypothetical protein